MKLSTFGLVASLAVAVVARGAGLALPEDFSKLRAVAEKGDAKAQYLVGIRYYMGAGTAKDLTEAINWTRKAAEQGDAPAQRFLSARYFNGDGVAKDSAEGMKWLTKASDGGEAGAQFELGFFYATGQYGLTKNPAEGLKLMQQGAEQDGESANRLALFYSVGQGVPKDNVEALKWYRKAAELGNARGQFEMGQKYARGNEIAKDPAEALKWLRRAAENGAVYALFLGKLYAGDFYTDIVPKDDIEALAWVYIGAAGGEQAAVQESKAIEKRLGPKQSGAAMERAKAIAVEIKKNQTPK